MVYLVLGLLLLRPLMAFLTVRLLDESKHHTIPYISTINNITIANSLPSWANAAFELSILISPPKFNSTAVLAHNRNNKLWRVN